MILTELGELWRDEAHVREEKEREEDEEGEEDEGG
jgi:hypothetical protein